MPGSFPFFTDAFEDNKDEAADPTLFASALALTKMSTSPAEAARAESEGAEEAEGPVPQTAGKRVAPFVSKLFDVCSRFPDICSFGEAGDTIIIHDPKARFYPVI